MHTLHEFFYFTKGTEHLIGLLCLISFVYFFRFLFDNDDMDLEH